MANVSSELGAIHGTVADACGFGLPLLVPVNVLHVGTGGPWEALGLRPAMVALALDAISKCGLA